MSFYLFLFASALVSGVVASPDVGNDFRVGDELQFAFGARVRQSTDASVASTPVELRRESELAAKSSPLFALRGLVNVTVSADSVVLSIFETTAECEGISSVQCQQHRALASSLTLRPLRLTHLGPLGWEAEDHSEDAPEARSTKLALARWVGFRLALDAAEQAALAHGVAASVVRRERSADSSALTFANYTVQRQDEGLTTLVARRARSSVDVSPQQGQHFPPVNVATTSDEQAVFEVAPTGTRVLRSLQSLERVNILPRGGKIADVMSTVLTSYTIKLVHALFASNSTRAAAAASFLESGAFVSRRQEALQPESDSRVSAEIDELGALVGELDAETDSSSPRSALESSSAAKAKAKGLTSGQTITRILVSLPKQYQALSSLQTTLTEFAALLRRQGQAGRLRRGQQQRRLGRARRPPLQQALE